MTKPKPVTSQTHPPSLGAEAESNCYLLFANCFLRRLWGCGNGCLALADAEDRNDKNNHDQEHEQDKASAGFGPDIGVALGHFKLDASKQVFGR